MHNASLDTMYGSGLNSGGTDTGHLYLRACADIAECEGQSFAAIFLDAVSAFAVVCRAIILPVPEEEATLAKRMVCAGFDDAEVRSTLQELQFHADKGPEAWKTEGCSAHLRLALAALMCNTRASFDGIDRVVRTSTGTMAGSPLSDLLFSLLMVRMLRKQRDLLDDAGLISRWNAR